MGHLDLLNLSFILGPKITDSLLFNYCKFLMALEMENASLRNWNDQNDCNIDVLTLKRTLSRPFIFTSTESLFLK